MTFGASDWRKKIACADKSTTTVIVNASYTILF